MSPVAPRTVAKPTTKKEQREASVENLLHAALKLFVSQGYRHTTVDQIADAAGLTKGAVYFYFRSKENLLVSLLDGVEETVVDQMITRVSLAQPGATEKIVAFVHGQAALGVTRAEQVLLLILMSLEFASDQDPVGTRIAAIYTRLYHTIEDIISFGRERGEFREDTGLKEQAAMVIAGHDGTFLEWYRRGAEFDGTELVRALRKSTLAGLTDRSE